ncbi:hypothetical protein Pla108_10770 [Botrimarina colliarenosi]|uniref:DUF4254 domain-containing protein n=1 Tax=Botrimarina colliarenosi TaxID=2528001 RepID=A0A5C6AJA9_9BACT|nr:DUF4254 domain-containing protein [Botrimarina colliarenosi]TWU00133.1 hypothetical protein Pla108_10770 [Botrimarina colliarenosi]
MPLDSTTIVRQVLQLQADAVARWHVEPIDNPYTGLLSVVCQQHQFNFQLWHEEDIARRTDVTDAQIAQVKRNIDGFNQRRNDWIERIDETLLEMLDARGVAAAPDAPLNTETPGSAIDRLSIMSLRVFHMEEELARPDATEEHLSKVEPKRQRCVLQRADLSNSLGVLLDDIFAGRKQLRVYRQMKMYNDPSLNPELYRSQRRAG